jgi:hypothetical protein
MPTSNETRVRVEDFEKMRRPRLALERRRRAPLAPFALQVTSERKERRQLGALEIASL